MRVNATFVLSCCLCAIALGTIPFFDMYVGFAFIVLVSIVVSHDTYVRNSVCACVRACVRVCMCVCVCVCVRARVSVGSDEKDVE